MIGIYKIVCKLDGMIYIGQSVDVKRRLKTHKRKLKQNMHPNSFLQNYVNKFGIKNFEFILIEECNISELDDKEVYWIAHYNSMDRSKGFNRESGGNLNRTFSQDRIESITGAGNPMFGKKHSKEFVKMIKEVNKGSSDKLTENDVREIKMALYLDIDSHELAEIFNIDYTTVNKIEKGHNWNWVLPELNESINNRQAKEKQKRNNTIYQLWNEGFSATKISRKLKIDLGAITKLLNVEIEEKKRKARERKELVRILFLEGKNKQEIIGITGICQTDYQRFTTDLNKLKRQEMIKKVHDLKSQGLINKDIAKTLNLHRTTVTEYLKKSV